MKLFKLLPLALAAALIAPVSGLAQNVKSCSRDSLKKAVDLYIAAQTKGDRAGLPFANGLDYKENVTNFDINNGIINKAMKIDFHRSFYDTATCQTYTEVIVTNKENPYVLGTRLRVVTDKISELEIIWTTTGHWLFNAEAYLKYSSPEKWDEIPAGRRDTRETLLFAANSYLDAFVDQNLDIVPWGYPCVRIEGGAYTAMDGEKPDSTCAVGVPSGVNIVNRRFVVDETAGTVAVFCTFGAGTPGGGSGAPDLHLFRVESGKLRYAHTLTHMLQSSFGGGGTMPKGSEYTKIPPGGAKPKGEGKPKAKP
jgi:hypothetical protein